MDNTEERKYVKVGNYIPADEVNSKDAVIERKFYGQGEQWTEELAECPVCGKWFWCYGKHYCPNCGAKYGEEPEENAWYVERWYDEDLINALEEIGVTASEKNLEKLKSSCLHIFDDKTVRNEMLIDKARELFEEE